MATCLVIEDSERVRELVANMARDLSLEVFESSDAASSAQMLKDHKPQVVLLDWDLPELGALDVLTAVAEAQIQPRPDVILLATENEPQQFVLARAAGANHYLLKPFERDDLAEVLEKCRIEIQRPS